MPVRKGDKRVATERRKIKITLQKERYCKFGNCKNILFEQSWSFSRKPLLQLDDRITCYEIYFLKLNNYTTPYCFAVWRNWTAMFNICDVRSTKKMTTTEGEEGFPKENKGKNVYTEYNLLRRAGPLKNWRLCDLVIARFAIDHCEKGRDGTRRWRSVGTFTTWWNGSVPFVAKD